MDSAETIAAAIPDALPSLYRLTVSLTRDPDTAQDLVQDAVARALERAEQFTGAGSPAAWMRGILYHLALDRQRRSSREVVVECVEERWMDDAYTVDPETFAALAEDRDRLEDALVRIPFIYRAVVVLHDAEGWKLQDIAELLDISLPAAKQRLRRGRMMLVTALGEERERRALLKGVPMRCWDARRHVSDYLDGTLDPETATLIEQHLETCPTCPPLVAGLVDSTEALAATRDPDTVLPPDLVAKIEGRLAEDRTAEA